MKTIIVDDEPWSLKELENVCEKIPNVTLEGVYDDPNEALNYAQTNTIDLAFLDIEMPLMSGIELAKQLRLLYPDVVIVFVTAFSEHLASSIATHADYFVLKPFTLETIEATINRAFLLARRTKKAIRVRTFGHFDVFVNDQPVVFSGKKAKELLAFIVNGAGGMMTPQEIYETVWADSGQDFNNYTAAVYRKMIKRLEQSLAEANCSNLLLASGGERALNLEACDCDLINFLNRDEWAITAYQGSYLDDYAWAKKQRQRLNGIKTEYLKATFK